MCIALWILSKSGKFVSVSMESEKQKDSLRLQPEELDWGSGEYPFTVAIPGILYHILDFFEFNFSQLL